MIITKVKFGSAATCGLGHMSGPTDDT